MNKKKLPISISDFRKVIEEGFYYVDKSLFIKGIIIEFKNVSTLKKETLEEAAEVYADADQKYPVRWETRRWEKDIRCPC